MIDLGGTTVPIGGMTLLPEDGGLTKQVNGQTFLRSGVLVDLDDYPDFPSELVLNPIGVLWEVVSSLSSAMGSIGNARSIAVSESGTIVTTVKDGTSTASFPVGLSEDQGVTWSQKTITAASAISATTAWYVVYVLGVFIVFTDSGHPYCYTSPDGTTWTARSTFPGNSHKLKVASNGEMVIARSLTNVIHHSTNGLSWTSANISGLTSAGPLAFGGGKFVAIGGDKCAVSTDGVTWTVGNLPVNLDDFVNASDGRMCGIVYGNGVFVAWADNFIMYSTDGLDWHIVSMPVVESYSSAEMIFTGNEFLLGTTIGCLYSPDGVNWSFRPVLNLNNTFVYGTLFGLAVMDGAAISLVDSYFYKSTPGEMIGATQYAPNAYLRIK